MVAKEKNIAKEVTFGVKFDGIYDGNFNNEKVKRDKV